jgi:hypothetical protein
VKYGKFYLLTFIVIIITFLYLLKIITFQPNIIALTFILLGLIILLLQQWKYAKQFKSFNPSTLSNIYKSSPKFNPPKEMTTLINTKPLPLERSIQTVGISDGATQMEKIQFLLKERENMENKIADLYERSKSTNADLKNSFSGIYNFIDKLNNSIQFSIANYIIGSYDKTLFGIVITICGNLIQIVNIKKTP